MMKEFEKRLQELLVSRSGPDWLIVHALSKTNVGSFLEFSFVDGEEREDEPFKTNPGYISPIDDDTLSELKSTLSGLTVANMTGENALANLFIVISRISASENQETKLIESFRKIIGPSMSQRIFERLITSLNAAYYSHYKVRVSEPKNAQEWLNLFQSVQYLVVISDPLIASLQLVLAPTERVLNYSIFQNMNSLLKAVIAATYDYDFAMSKEQIDIALRDANSAAFLAAYVLDRSAPENTLPSWCSQEMASAFVREWPSVGKYVFVHVFGINFRNKNKNDVYDMLSRLLSNSLSDTFLSDKNASGLIDQLVFPHDFIALFHWLNAHMVDFERISPEQRKAFIDRLILELKRISGESELHISDSNRMDPFNSYSFDENRYANAMAYLLLLLVEASPAQLTQIKKICYHYKVLFYGSYRAQSLALRFSELILLIALSGRWLVHLEQSHIDNLRSILDIVGKSILIPFVHLTEREEDIWNPEAEKPAMNLNSGLSLVNRNLRETKNHEVSPHYADFFCLLDEIKVGRWPYERDQDLQQTVD